MVREPKCVKIEQGLSMGEYFFRQTAPIVVWATGVVSFYLYATGKTEVAVIGSFTLHISDILFGVISIYCVAGALTRWYRSFLEMLLLLLCLLLLLSFARGLAIFGSTAGVAFRTYAVFTGLAAFVYFWGRTLNVDWVFRKIVWLGWGIVGLSVLRLIFGLDTFVLADPVQGYEMRTLGANSALMLGMAALIAPNLTMSAQGRAGRWMRWLTFVVFLATLLISNQRTAIFATFAGASVSIIFLPQRYRPIIVLGTAMLILAGIFLWIAWGAGSITEYLPRAITMMSSDEGTFAAREGYWALYLDAYSRSSMINQILGLPFGSPELIIVEGNEFLPSAHNGYVQLLLNTGAVGVTIFILLVAFALIKSTFLLSMTDSTGFKLRLATAIIVSHAIFSISYSLPIEQGLLFAVALQVIARVSKLAKHHKNSISAPSWRQLHNLQTGT
jgi:hypothetical protein